MQVEKLVAGSYFVTHEKNHILVGFPPEITKLFLAKKLPIPTCWLLPDRKIFQGISQYSTEFPFYHFLFFSSPPNRPEKLTVIGTAEDLEINNTILEAALLGPSAKEMAAWNVESSIANTLTKELEYLALKDKEGEVLPVHSFLKQVPFTQEEFVEIGEGLSVRHCGFNKYEFKTGSNETEILTIDDDPTEFFPYQLSPIPPLPNYYSNLKILGGGNGFTPNHPCTGFLIEHQGIRLLIDAGPYIGQLTQHHGISLSQIHGIYLTHIHDDHSAGLTEFVQSGNKITLFSTLEVAHAAFQKLALLYNQTESQIAQNFRFVPIAPNKRVQFYGMSFSGNYSLHSVPCFGIDLHLKVQNQADYRLIYPSDTLKLERVHELYKANIIDRSRYEQYLEFLNQPADLMIYDSGAGIIHADSKDLENLHKKKNYLCVHTDKISPEMASRFSLAHGGDTYSLARPLSPLPSYISFEAFEFLVKLFPDASTTWIKVLLEDALLSSFNPEELILHKGQENNTIYLLLSGSMELLISSANSDSKPRSLSLVPGDLFSTKTLENRSGDSNASIKARSIGLYLSFSGQLFQQFLQGETLTRAMQEYFEIRSFLEHTPLVCELDLHTKNELASIARKVLFHENATILTQGEESRDCYLIREGSVQIFKKEADQKKIFLGKTDIFGERALLLGKKRNATVIANSEVLCYQFEHLRFQNLCAQNSELRSQLEKLIRSREEIPA